MIDTKIVLSSLLFRKTNNMKYILTLADQMLFLCRSIKYLQIWKHQQSVNSHNKRLILRKLLLIYFNLEHQELIVWTANVS